MQDISSLIDGYPTSLCALSTKHLYIGTQMRSNGYLFETTDAGGTWAPVFVNDRHYRYGFVDKDKETLYVLLEYIDEASDKDYSYHLYCLDSSEGIWEKEGYFIYPSGAIKYKRLLNQKRKTAIYQHF